MYKLIINNKCPKSGLHNFYKHPEKFREIGDVLTRLVGLWNKPEVTQYYTDLVRLCVPKSDFQARYEFIVTRNFMENFTGDNRIKIFLVFLYPSKATLILK